MTLRTHNLALKISHRDDALKFAILDRFHIIDRDLTSYKIVNKAIDSRKKGNIRFIYTVDIELNDEEKYLENHKDGNFDIVKPLESIEIKTGDKKLSVPPIVVGSGPSGLFAALYLARNGYKPTVIERGAPVDQRVADVKLFVNKRRLNTESNILFGEGGAGTFSDGKLTTRIKSNFIPHILEDLKKHGTPPEALIISKPHLGTDGLRTIVTNIRNEIETLGGQFLFNTRVDKLSFNNNNEVNGVYANDEFIEASAVFLGIGHSARDTYRTLHEQGLNLERKVFQFGLRIEHKQDFVNKCMFGDMAGHPRLGAAEYSLVSKTGNDLKSVTTFCMCPGGEIIAATAQPGKLCTNGMSWSGRDGKWANSALMTAVSPDDLHDDDIFAGIRFQENIEEICFEMAGGGYQAPAQNAHAFLKRKFSREPIESSYRIGTMPVDWNRLLPPDINVAIAEALKKFDRIMKGFSSKKATLLGPETRGSSPIRITRDNETRESVSHKKLYPIGEGAGYAGGIMSSAVDGMKSAVKFMEEFAPPD